MRRQTPVGIVLLVLLGSAETTAQSAPAGGYKLAQCVAYARLNHPSVRLARLNERISAAQRQQVIGQNLPQVSVSGSVLDNVKIPVQLLPGEIINQPGTTVPIRFGVQYNTTLTGRVDQKLVDPALGLALKAANLSTQVQLQATAQAEQTQAYNVAQAYYQTLTIDLQRRLNNRDLRSSDTLLRQEQVRLANGTARPIDLGRIQLNRNNLLSQLEQNNRRYDQALNELKFQMGMPLRDSLVLEPLDLEQALPETQLSAPDSRFYERRPDFRQLVLNTQLQDINRQINNRGYWPSLNLYGTYATNAQRQTFDFFHGGLPWFQSATIGLTLAWTPFDGNRRRYRDQENRLNVETLRLQQLLSQESAQVSSSNAQTTYRNLLLDIRHERDNVALARQILTVTELEFREGIATSVTLIDAKDALTTAQNNLANKLLGLYQAQLDYEQAQGTILDYVLHQ